MDPMQHDDRTLAEIANDPDAVPGEPDDSELDNAEVRIDPSEHLPIPNIIANALATSRTIQEAREEANIPPHFTVAQLAGREIVLAWKAPQQAALPDSGEMRNGYICNGAFTDTRQEFTVWIGQTVLLKDLQRVALPFRTTIVKHGRTFQFS